jgi:hypothetical protein
MGTQQDAQEFYNELNNETIRTQHEDRSSQEMRVIINDSSRVRTKLENILSLKYEQKMICKVNHESVKNVTDFMLILNFDNYDDELSNAISLNTLIDQLLNPEIEGFKR